MTDNDFYYKVVRRDQAGRMWSVVESPYQVEYKQGEESKGQFPLFVFGNYDDALEFKNDFGADEIWTATATGVREVPHKIPSWEQPEYWELYWWTNKHLVPIFPSLDRTYICDSVTLIEQVRLWDDQW